MKLKTQTHCVGACVALRKSCDRYRNCFKLTRQTVFKSVNRLHLPKESLIFCGSLSNSSRIMEQPQAKRKVSTMWDHFDLISENKVFVSISTRSLNSHSKGSGNWFRSEVVVDTSKLFNP